MHAVTTQLDRFNPEGMWSRAGLGNVPARVAAEKYIDAVQRVVTAAHVSLLSDLTEILWNGEHIAKDALKRAEVAPSPNRVLETALEAAVLNRCGVEGYQALYNDIQKSLNPSFGIRSSGIAAVLSALQFSKSDPAGMFLKTLISTADLGCHQMQMLKRACKATGGICEPNSIRQLLSLRHTLSSAARPMQFELVEYPEYRAQTILKDVLTDYHKVFSGNLIVKTALTPTSLPLSNGSALTADDIKAKKLLVASRILAGIPLQELGRLLRYWDQVS
jgi:hypothetical protein